MSRRAAPGRALFVSLVLALLTACAQPQPPAPPMPAATPAPPPASPAARPSTPDCLAADDITNLQIVGRWSGEFPDDQRTVSLLLELHPQFADSFAGTLERPNGEKARVVGDIESGDFTMEESPDGVRIAATWLGDVVADSCGREIRGQWQAATGRTTPFILRKQ